MRTVLNYYIYPDSFIPNLNYTEKPNLEFVELFISDKCQLSCAHCFHGNVRCVESPLSFSEWCSVIDQLLDIEVKHIHVAGGDPFYDKKALQVLQYLGKKRSIYDFKFGCITNGLNFSKCIEAIKDFNIDYIDFSMDGLREGHESLRGRNSFNRTFEAILLSLKVFGTTKTYVSSVANKSNVFQIPEMIVWLAEHGISRFFIQPIQPYGSALRLKHLLLSAYDYAKLIDSCAEAIQTGNIQRIGLIVYVASPMLEDFCSHSIFARDALESYLSGKGTKVKLSNALLKFRFQLRCAVFERSCIITADGHYIASCEVLSLSNYKDFSAGSVRDNKLPELIDKSVKNRRSFWSNSRLLLNNLIINDNINRPLS